MENYFNNPVGRHNNNDFIKITYKGIWYILIYHDLRYLLNAIRITIYKEKEKEKQIYIFKIKIYVYDSYVII